MYIRIMCYSESWQIIDSKYYFLKNILDFDRKRFAIKRELIHIHCANHEVAGVKGVCIAEILS